MDSLNDDIILSDNLDGTAGMQQRGYITHALCHGGSCLFQIGSKSHRFSAGDCLIIPQTSIPMRNLHADDNFRTDVIYVSPTFIEASTPQSNYGMRGHLALFENPVMHLTAEQQKVCALNFDYIRRRLSIKTHNFHRDAMINAIQCMIIDFYDFHVELYGERPVSSQQALLMQRFLSLLERADYRSHREVSHYADELCVTPKYLSEVCRKVSGQSALYWINRYTALDIIRTLRDRTLSLADISDMFSFSSLSYFCRYVQNNLGSSPSDLRE